jgi:DNA-binding MarR family transcriptional regulator
MTTCSKPAPAAVSPPTLAQEIGKRDPFDLPQREAMLNVLRTAARLSEPFERYFRTEGLSGPLFNILRILAGRGPEGLPSMEIGAQMIAPAPDVTRLVDRLVRLGLAERRSHSADRRVVRVAITEAGRATLERINPAVARLHVEALAGLDAGELETVNRLMEKARATAFAASRPSETMSMNPAEATACAAAIDPFPTKEYEER